MHEWVHCHNEASNHQLPIAAAFWIIWIISMDECSSLMENLMQICGSTYSVILNVTATQYTCSLRGIYCPHWLVQWSHHCSCTFIPVHSPWLPGYIDVTQTVLIILTMVGLFLGIQWNITWLLRKSEILPLVTMWIDLEGIMVSEISQRKTNTIWFFICVESKHQNKQNRNRLIDTEFRLPGGRGLGGLGEKGEDIKKYQVAVTN